jgi:hypothetical protein
MPNASNRNYFYTAIFFSGLSLFIGACGIIKGSKKQDTLPGTWQLQPVTIDGDSKDWPSPYPNYDSKAMIAYATSNDKENLYITVETGDVLTQMKILEQGMVVSVDTGRKRENHFKISYPLQNDADPLEPPKTDDGQLQITRTFEQKLARQAEKANQLAFEGFSRCVGGFIVTQTTPCGIKVRMRIDEYKQLVWEAKIPFKELYGKEQITAADAERPVSVCFAIKAFKDPDAKNKQTNTGTMSNPMDGTAAGRNSRQQNMPVGGQNVQVNPLQRLFESTKTWKHFRLAYQ